MRRLVVVSNKKSKVIAASVATFLALTSIHLAAAARMESLRLQQEQLEQVSTNIARLSLSQSSFSQSSSSQRSLTLTPIPDRQTDATSQTQAESTASNPQEAEPTPPALPASATARNRRIVISIADRQLAVLDNGQVIKIYAIAVGTRNTPSPDGDFVIVNHAKDPTYRHADMEIGPGKDNPLGSRWMGLSMKGYGIHGTNVQSSVGKAASHGCFRMRKHDVEELYSLVQVGDTVTVRRERDEMITQVFSAPATTLAATSVLSAKTQSGGDVQMASASETATVETSEQ